MNNIEGMCRYSLRCGCVEEEEDNSLRMVEQCSEKHTLMDVACDYPTSEMIVDHKWGRD